MKKFILLLTIFCLVPSFSFAGSGFDEHIPDTYYTVVNVLSGSGSHMHWMTAKTFDLEPNTYRMQGILKGIAIGDGNTLDLPELRGDIRQIDDSIDPVYVSMIWTNSGTYTTQSSFNDLTVTQEPYQIFHMQIQSDGGDLHAYWGEGSMFTIRILAEGLGVGND